jgi:mycothiol synthase
MSSSLPEGYTSRSATPADAGGIDAVITACDVALMGWSESRPEDVAAWFRSIDLDNDTWIVEHDGAIVACMDLMKHGEIAETDGFVHPDHTGRGLGTWLRDRAEERTRAVGLSRVHTWCLEQDAVTRALLETRGMTEVRRYYRMVIDVVDPPEPNVPDGIRIATYRDEDARAFHDALTESFADEWNFVPLTFDEWVKRRVEDPDTDTSLWFIAWDGDEIAGVNRCDPNRFGMGWIGALGVRDRWRKRGIGLALLQHAFAEFHRRGLTKVGLGVDASNPTGATRLYERAGMHVAYAAVSFAKELA